MLQRIAEALGVSLPYDDLASYRHDFTAQFGPHSATEATLTALDRARALGWTICVVTNGDRPQLAKIERSGLAPHIDACVLSDEVGHRKPDPEIFHIAARQTGCTLTGAWMIGDMPATDIAGATAAGLPSVWISNGQEWPDVDFQPTATAPTAAEAIELVLA